MLNLGKVTLASWDYYLNQVAAGQEEYYTGVGESPGQIVPTVLAERLGIAGVVDADRFRRLLGGLHPDTGERLRHREVTVLAFDVAFRPAKGVSLLWGLGGPDLAGQVEAGHTVAVQAAVEYLEQHAAVARRGAAGREQVAGDGLLVVAFRHRTSRAGDPLLHDHVLVANLTRGPDGQWTALDGRGIYQHLKTARYLYHAVLRAELTRRLGVKWGPVNYGMADVEGIPREVVEAFSQRRRQVLGRLQAWGVSGPRAAEVACLDTRPAKERGVTEDALRARWLRRATELGFGQDDLLACLGRAGLRLPASVLAGPLLDELIGEGGLTEQGSTFTRREVIQAICERLPAGATAEEIQGLADRLLARGEVIAEVGWQPVGQPIRDAGLLAEDASRYTTRDHLAVEARLLRAATDRQAQGIAVVPASVTDHVLAGHERETGKPLDPGQTQMVRTLTGSGDGVAVAEAAAGSGKTTALGVARQAWEETGHTVIGAALAARAAQQLTQGAGMPARTIARLLRDLDRGRRRLDARTVLVIDEAGMVGTRTLARLLAHAADAGAKLVLVGDARQLPEIEAGGAFQQFAVRLGAIRLRSNHRQHARWERHALSLLRAGDVDAAIRAYNRRGRVVIRATPEAARHALVADWRQLTRTQRHGAEPVLMLAARRADVDQLNELARQRLCRAGQLGTEALTIQGKQFAVGEQIMTLRNAYRLGVLNGTRATITGIDHQAGSVRLRTDDGRDILLPRGYLHPAPGQPRRIDYAYATTVHKAQGLTAARSLVLATGMLTRRWAYTALSRGQLDNRLYLAASDLPRLDEVEMTPSPRRHPVSALRDQLNTTGDKRMAVEYLAETQPVHGAAPACTSVELDL